MTKIVETKAILNIYREYVLCIDTSHTIHVDNPTDVNDEYVLHIVRDPEKRKIYGTDNILEFLKSKLSNSRYLKVEKYFMEMQT
jgi:hypothetical protein